ncbi:hypothetical protein DPMN_020033 [Dreissena polymorpha]|uniref:Uncharacterized protein n=1 Tax=Dreissena polymorpha TaxID=45954 RepID=A0A9D4NJI2_DREPO|nr:hypothetical protein DPMN_020033 [Dreissena polymorpha]
MARQRPTRLVMGPCIAEIDLHHQLEVNWCRNEEVIGAPGLVIVPCIVEIDRIVIREVQYQFEVNRCRNEEIIVKAILGGCGLVMGPCIVEIDPNVIREVQYQFEVNPCRNEKIIVNGIFWWVWPMWAGAPGLGLGPCIVEIDPNVITKVQYQFEVNPCRKEKIIVNGNFWWVWPMWAGRPRIDRIVIREVQYQFEVNRCRNKEVNFQGSSAFSVGGDSGQDGRTDRQTDGWTDGGDNHNIPTFFSKSSPTGDRLYIISGWQQYKLLTLARDGTLLATYSDQALVRPEGQVLVCGRLSNTVLQLATLATQKDGMRYPVSVCYSSSSSSIIVGLMGSDHILDNDAEDVVDKNKLNTQKSVQGLNAWTKCMYSVQGLNAWTKCMCVKCGTKCMCVKGGTKCILFRD